MGTFQRQPDRPSASQSEGASDLIRGLRWFAGLSGSLALASFVVRLLGQAFVDVGGWALAHYIRHGVETAALIAIAALVWGLVVHPKMQDSLRTKMGVAVYLAFGSVTAFRDLVELDPAEPSFSASVVGLVVLIYPLMVPASRRHHVTLISLSAAYLPVGALVAFGMGTYGHAAVLAVVLAAVAKALPTWAACGVAWWVVLEQERRRRRIDDIEDDLAQLGSYTLESKIGEGGMGEVWRARHAFLARPAALKLIRAKSLVGGNSAEEAQERARVLIARFEREAQATARLTSPHTVQVYDYGSTGGDLFFYVMELLDGTDLWSLVYRFGPQPEELVHHVLLQACDSVGEAHRNGLIHRDLKPANLFLCRQGQQLDVTKVLDFGLVKSPAALRGERTETQMRLTQHGMVSGTPAYMSPEQAAGNRDLDGRSDLYALACVAYFMLTGHEIFEDSNPIKVMLGQIERPPVPPRVRNPHLKLSPDFEAVLVRLLQKRRDDRFRDAEAMAEALRNCRLARPWDQASAMAWWKKVSGDSAQPDQASPAPRPAETEEAPLPTEEAVQLRALRESKKNPAH